MKRRLLAVGMSAAVGITMFAAPVAALNQSACDGIAAAVESQPSGLEGLGQRIGALLEEVSEAIGGDVGPDAELLVPGVRYIDGGLCK